MSYVAALLTLLTTTTATTTTIPGAGGIAAAVLRKLKGKHELQTDDSMKFIQGLRLCLERRGFGAVLVTARASSVKEQILELARKKFYAEARKRGEKNKVRFSVAKVAAMLETIEETFTAPDGTEQPVDYLVGWTLIPPAQMNGGHKHFRPVDALDCANMRGQAGGELMSLSMMSLLVHTYSLYMS